MKQILIIVLTFAVLTCKQADAQVKANVSRQDKPLYAKLLKMDFKSHAGKKAGDFLKVVGYPYRKYLIATKKPGYIDRIIFRYSDSLSVDIAVSDLGQKEPLDYNYKFNIEEFKTKKIKWICLRYAGNCIKGCEKEDCF